MAEGAESVLEQNPEEAPVAVAVSGLAQEAPLTAAFQLGWRVAELYALVNDPGEPSDDTLDDTLLPAHESLEPGDQLQLQLRAAAGDARRAGIAAKADELEALLRDAGEAPGSAEAAQRFRAKIRSFHIEISKELWAGDEAAGKAYELANGMSDTYSLIRIAYRTRSEDLTAAWERAFRKRRIERLEKLLDDLQSRLNPGGVAVVRHHLDLWREAVPARVVKPGRPPEERRVRCGLRRQTVIWRQLLAGDKEPVAYLNGAARAELHGEVRGLAWRGVRPWLIPAALGLFAFIFFLPEIVGLYQDGIVGTGVASAFLAVAGALGVTKASMAATLRSRLHGWSALLWDRAVAQKVSEKTLVLEEVLTEPVPDRGRIASASRAVKGKVGSRPSAIAPRPSRPASL